MAGALELRPSLAFRVGIPAVAAVFIGFMVLLEPAEPPPLGLPWWLFQLGGLAGLVLIALPIVFRCVRLEGGQLTYTRWPLPQQQVVLEAGLAARIQNRGVSFTEANGPQMVLEDRAGGRLTVGLALFGRRDVRRFLAALAERGVRFEDGRLFRRYAS